MSVKRLVQRGLYYVQTGAALGGLPLTLLNFVTIFYYNAIVNIPFLGNIFTNFIVFAVLASVVAVVSFGCLGYFFKRKSRFYSSQVEVDVDANPYMRSKIVPTSIPVYEAFVELFKKYDIDTTEIEALLRNSESKKYCKAEDKN